ncbi:MAG: DUF4249 family protein [Saprospiraceae bacterium]
MMRHQVIPGFFFLSCFLFVACEQDDIASIDSKTPVVASYLYAGQTLDSLRVTLSFSYGRDDTTLIALDNLDIRIMEGDKSYPLFNIGEGYYNHPNLLIENEKSYNLSFSYEGASVNAATFVPGKREAQLSTNAIEMAKITNTGGFPGGGFAEIDPIEVTWENPENDYYYVLIENMETDPEYINDFLAQLEGNFGRRFSLITQPEITDFHNIDPRREITQFGRHRVIVFRVTPEYAALYATSGTSSTNITEPPSNIVNGLGIFTGVSSDTLFFEVKKQ